MSFVQWLWDLFAHVDPDLQDHAPAAPHHMQAATLDSGSEWFQDPLCKMFKAIAYFTQEYHLTFFVRPGGVALNERDWLRFQHTPYVPKNKYDGTIYGLPVIIDNALSPGQFQLIGHTVETRVYETNPPPISHLLKQGDPPNED